jgi:FdhE protein
LRALAVEHQRRDTVWKAVLREWVLDFSPDAESLADTLRRLSMATSAELDHWADAMLAGAGEANEAGLWPFIAAALQVVYVAKASQLNAADFAHATASHECPACGLLPVAGLIKSGGNLEGLRYLHCGLCSTEWHRPRIRCIHCDSSEKVAYYAIEGAGDTVRAETCDACRSYGKLIVQDKNPAADPCADDVATLGLDVLMNEQGYSRLGCNFFLMPSLSLSS